MNLNYDVLNIINYIFMSLFPILYLSQNLFTFLAIFIRAKKIPQAKKMHSFGYIICAHDEEKVVGQLIESIMRQDYPEELMHIFVVCDNCSDDTIEIAKQYGVYTIERHNLMEIGKCYALDLAVKTILNEYQHLDIEAFMVFDADNLVTKDYTRKMNDIFDAGYLVSTSYRNSKNFDKKLIAGWAGVTFLRECEIIHTCRSAMNIGTYVSGTGFYVAKTVLDELGGWPFDALIEDIEFSIYCANQKIKIGYCENAEFYDEQPENFRDAYNQRLRWCRGNHQCFFRHWWSLLKNGFKKRNFACFEMFTHTSPTPAITFLWIILYSILLGINAITNQLSFMQFLNTGFITVINYFVIVFILALIQATVALIKSRKRIKCSKALMVVQIFLFPILMSWLLVVSTIALFKRVKWKKINHNNSVSIEEVRGDN